MQNDNKYLEHVSCKGIGLLASIKCMYFLCDKASGMLGGLRNDNIPPIELFVYLLNNWRPLTTLQAIQFLIIMTTVCDAGVKIFYLDYINAQVSNSWHIDIDPRQ